MLHGMEALNRAYAQFAARPRPPPPLPRPQGRVNIPFLRRYVWKLEDYMLMVCL